ncbi:MAG TPA: DUF4097 family beta strand repeat-containing protein [Acidimicrobiia bacterium]|jgi:hypothetical protein
MTRGLWRIGGSGLTALLLVWGSANVVAQISFDSRSFTRVVTTPVSVVDFNIHAGTLDVVAVPGSRVVVHAVIHRGLIRTHTSFHVDGDRLVVRASCAPVLDQNCQAHYRVEVPPATRVVAHAKDRVNVTGTTNALEALAGEGSVTLTDVTGPVVAHASEGTVHATGLRSTDVQASAGEGSVDLSFATDPHRVDAHASEGHVAVVVPHDGTAYRVDAGASEGSTRVQIPTDPRSTLRIRAHASEGSVTVEPAP